MVYTQVLPSTPYITAAYGMTFRGCPATLASLSWVVLMSIRCAARSVNVTRLRGDPATSSTFAGFSELTDPDELATGAGSARQAAAASAATARRRGFLPSVAWHVTGMGIVAPSGRLTAGVGFGLGTTGRMS